jgi:hypothetical protein
MQNTNDRTALGRGMKIPRGRIDLGEARTSEIELLRAAHPDAQIHLSVDGDALGDFDASSAQP